MNLVVISEVPGLVVLFTKATLRVCKQSSGDGHGFAAGICEPAASGSSSAAG
jgi:hypothetical protein